MKKWVVFLLGFLTGIVFTVVLSLVISSSQVTSGIAFYDKPGKTLFIQSVTVFQGLSKQTALVKESGKEDFKDQIYLLYDQENQNAFYDGQVVYSEPGKQFVIVGVYSYTTAGGMQRTVPVISK